MSNINTEKLIDDLVETGKRSNIRLAKRIAKRHYSNIFCPRKDVPKMRKTDELATKALYGLLDEPTLKTLITYDVIIENLIQKIMSKTDWDYYPYCQEFRLYDNFQNMGDPEFRSFDTYRVYRTEDGFTHSTKDPYNGYFQSRQDREKRFVKSNKSDLKDLHHTYCLKEKLLKGNIKLKDDNTRDLAMELIYFLHLIEEPKEEKVFAK